MERINNKCTMCKRAIVAMGNTRTNNKTGLIDWNTRPMHKKCFIQFVESQQVQIRMRNIEDALERHNPVANEPINSWAQN
jgi:hypothetical protein